MPIELTPQRGLLFRITHIANVPWLLAHGLHAALEGVSDPNFISIGNLELIDKRKRKLVPIAPGGMLSDYVPFYFTPKSPMLYNIKTGYNGITQRPNDDIAILVSNVDSMTKSGVEMLFTDRHAYMDTATWTSDPAQLADMLDWDILRRHDFARTNDYPDKMDRYQAEALARSHVPPAALLGIACASPASKPAMDAAVEQAGADVKVFVRPTWYF